MTLQEIHNKVLWTIIFHFSLDYRDNLSSASFKNDLNLNNWEINMLFYYVEQAFNLKLRKDLDYEIDSINQLVQILSKDYSQKRGMLSKQLSIAC